MNISEVYVGPLFVGVLAIGALALPIYPEIADLTKHLNIEKYVAFSGLVLGFAYLIGIILDRVIDTALEPIERHNRLQFACKQIRSSDKKQPSLQTGSAKDYTWNDDPYPEDTWRAAIMLNMAAAANAWIDGLRTKIRLTRTATFMFPAVAFALAFAIARYYQPGLSTACFYGLLVVAIGLPILVQAALADRDPIDSDEARNHKRRLLPSYWRGTFAPPRTDNKSKLQSYAEERRWISKSEVPGRSVLFDIIFSAFALYLIILTAGALAVWAFRMEPNSQGDIYWMSFLSGIAMALLALWAWWRTTGTFMGYLRIMNRQRSAEPKPVENL